VELGAFLRAQPHYVLLDGNLFRSCRHLGATSMGLAAAVVRA
jgi:hypothetical protein